MTNSLKTLFASAHQRLAASLHGAAAISHPGEKGCASETDWRTFLCNHLPLRYAVTSAFLVDATGRQSEQLDVVIYDRFYSPLLLDHSGVRFLPAEAVYAVFEVKQDFSKKHVEYAAKKVASARKLTRSSAAIVDRGETRDPRPLPTILGGLLATTSGWTPPLGEPLKDALAACDSDEKLHLGVAAAAGAFEIMEDGAVRTSEPDNALMFFFLALLRRLQAIGTVPAIDWTEYEAAL